MFQMILDCGFNKELEFTDQAVVFRHRQAPRLQPNLLLTSKAD